MSAYFFDSSALVKRYIIEAGSKWVISLLKPSANNTIFIAQIAGVEVTSAIARRRKGLKITPIKATKSILRFQKDFQFRFFQKSLSPSLVELAMQFADKHELRGYDAVQLASAVESDKLRQINGLSPVIFVSADSTLNAAAQAEGLAVENPNNYP
jgi:uncharacterized protein